jgi:hypothetical protein
LKTRQISDESVRARTPSVLVEQLPLELLQNAFDLTELFGNKYHSASAQQSIEGTIPLEGSG